MTEKKNDKKVRRRRRSAETSARIKDFVSYILEGMTKADAYRKAFNCQKKTAAAMAVNLYRQPDVQDMIQYAKQRAAQEIAERTSWTKEQSVTGLKEVISLCRESILRKMNMPAIVGITNAMKELNAMHNLTGKDINVSQSTVIFQNEDKLED